MSHPRITPILQLLSHAHTHTHTHVHVHTHTHTHTHTHMHILTHTHTHTNTHTHIHTETLSHIHAHTRTHARAHTRTPARTHAHTHLQLARLGSNEHMLVAGNEGTTHPVARGHSPEALPAAHVPHLHLAARACRHYRRVVADVCVCVRVCEREKEGRRKRANQRLHYHRIFAEVCMCVCVLACVCVCVRERVCVCKRESERWGAGVETHFQEIS